MVYEAVEKIQEIYQHMSLMVNIIKVDSYNNLPFVDDSFDLGWNFSALWFVQDLYAFLKELCRISKKIILICVPNQSGLGYKWQRTHTDIPPGMCFHQQYIDPPTVKQMMRELGWNSTGEAFIDCPPWPD